MKLVQENSLTQDKSCTLSIEKVEKNVVLTIENKDFLKNTESTCVHTMSKNDLSNLIGGLLHIQSKFNR